MLIGNDTPLPPPPPSFAAAPTLPPDFEDATWARLAAAVDAVFGERPAAASFEDLYRVRERERGRRGGGGRAYARRVSVGI